MVIYKFNNPGSTLYVRVFQSPTIDGTKTQVDQALISDLLPEVDGKVEWTVAAADDTQYSWLAAWDGSVLGAYSAAILPAGDLANTVAISTLIPLVQGDLVGCSRYMILHALRESIREFCRRTMAWEFAQDDITPVEGQMIYTLQEPSGTEIVDIVQAYQDGAGGMLTSKDVLPITQLAGNLAQYYTRPERTKIAVYPVPSEHATIPFTVTVALQPTTDGTLVDYPLVSKYQDALLSGALKQLMLQPNKPWSNPALGQYHRQIFEDRILDEQINRLKGGTSGVTQLEYAKFI
jgi:hypothetical protein